MSCGGDISEKQKTGRESASSTVIVQWISRFLT